MKIDVFKLDQPALKKETSNKVFDIPKLALNKISSIGLSLKEETKSTNIQNPLLMYAKKADTGDQSLLDGSNS